MEIILIIIEDKELIKNIPGIKLQNYNILVLSNIKYIKHYMEEYMPKYVILSAKIKNYVEIVEYINGYTASELLITDLEKKKNTISGDTYVGRIDNIEDLKRVLDIIDNLNLKINRKEEEEENSCKFIPQKIISFCSVQGGVGKTSMVFNFAWHIKDIVDGKILIIDLNFCEGQSDLAVSLGLNLSPNLSVFIEKIAQGKEALSKSIINLDNDKIDILQPPLSIYQSDKFSIDMLDSIIYSARNNYDIIISDIPFRYDNISLEMLNLSTTSILVLSPNVKLASRVSNFHKFLPIGQKKGIIFNKVGQGKKTYIDEYTSILDIPICDRIPFIPEEDRKMVTRGSNFFDILDLQSRMSNLRNFIF